MDLRTFLAASDRGVAASIARAVGVSPVMVTQWAGGVKPIPVERVRSIEAATGFEVRPWDMRADDWATHWPELIGVDGAPAPITTQEA